MGKPPFFDFRTSRHSFFVPAFSCDARYNKQDGQITLTGYVVLRNSTDGMLSASNPIKVFDGGFYFVPNGFWQDPNQPQDPSKPPAPTPNPPSSFVLAGDAASSFTRDLDLKHLGFQLNYGQIFCLTPTPPITEPIEGPKKPKLSLHKTGKLGDGGSVSPGDTPTEPPQCTQGESLQVTLEIEDNQ